MQRVDCRTNALQTNQPTNQPMDTASYRGALSHLKREKDARTQMKQFSNSDSLDNSILQIWLKKYCITALVKTHISL